MKGKKVKLKFRKGLNLIDAEDLSTYEVEVKEEDLRCDEEEGRDMISEGDFDDSSVISRVKLF